MNLYQSLVKIIYVGVEGITSSGICRDSKKLRGKSFSNSRIKSDTSSVATSATAATISAATATYYQVHFSYWLMLNLSVEIPQTNNLTQTNSIIFSSFQNEFRVRYANIILSIKNIAVQKISYTQRRVVV